MELVDVKKIASELDLTSRRIQQLVTEGLPRDRRGRYDVQKCFHWYVRYVHAAIHQKKVSVASDAVYASEREERLRLLRADADLRELELAKQRSQLISIDDFDAVLTDLILVTKARIMSIPPRVAPDIVGETSRLIIQGKLDKACKESLSYLAKQGEKIGNKIGTRNTSERES
jgi:phage terminase Nu1 subunit (DNA packaging protein)